MDTQSTVAAPIHYYDTSHRTILCGLHGFAHRSTKHARAVTCPSCVALLKGEPAEEHLLAGEPSAGAVVH
ncbi:hypothetical protein [Anaeromyxobacter oryzisoli]|jgi:hypothetical protein|uniref:hypothetical protein n=1 Tax=Anaeromyxobacter oryzisoli TaxID=2925408 RepID=UPI001F5A065B|nr:hypothetical protein [Anaeromyxobacter sp. SG63]